MPYNTFGGFPPLPTQVACGTVYEPKQSSPILSTKSKPANQRNDDVDYVDPRQRSSMSTQHASTAGDADNNDSGHHAATFPLLGAPPRLSGTEHGIAPEGRTPNPWFTRVSLAEVEDRRQYSPSGVAVFRPRRLAGLNDEEGADFTMAGTAEPPSAANVKPLLEPYLNAQDLANEASEETWHVRRLRYLQWLRKGAATAKRKEEQAMADASMEISLMPGDLLSGISRPALLGGGGGGSSSTSSAGAARRSSWLPSLEKSAVSHTALSDSGARDTRVFENSAVHPLLGNRLGEDTVVSEFEIPNANEVAVRQLFWLAQGTSPSAPPSPTAAAQAGADTSTDADSTATPSSSQDRKKNVFSAQSSRSRSVVEVVSELPLEDAVGGHSYVDKDGFSYNHSLRDSAWDATNVAIQHDRIGDDGEDDDASIATSTSTVEPPSEYAVAALLRGRMHNTVATFTASSVHTLDDPPTKVTRRVLGQARLNARDTATTRTSQLVPINHSTTNPNFKDDGTSGTVGRRARPLSSRTVRRLVYEETYERGLLCQLAFQSSPTRWYSSELPSGQEGLAFRKVYAPAMLSDAELHSRLTIATTSVIQTIAQPRQDNVEAQQERQKTRLAIMPRVDDRAARRAAFFAGETAQQKDQQPHQSAAPTTAAVAVFLEHALVEAAKEKELMFEQWTRLHSNLSAQWNLFHDEQASRLRLLGQFLSCAYPEPCVCVECDQEVLNMSAIPLEPMVRPLCWYTSVVLSGHHDVLQKELLAEYEEGMQRMYAEFRLLFIAIYTRQKLVEEEARRFDTMLRYHQFCLHISSTHPSLHASVSTLGASMSLDASRATVEPDPQSLTGTDPGMWRFRQRRLQAYKAFDSPFFSYLVYVEMTTVSSAEEQVRRQLVEQETQNRRELLRLRRIDEQMSALLAAERRQRSWISAEMMESHSAMLTGPLVQLHAAHMAEIREKEATAYAKACAKVQQTFLHAALEEKHAAMEREYAQYKILVREIRQQFLTIVVSDRSHAQSVATSRGWLVEQRQNVLLRTEQRLRDRIALVEEQEAFQAIRNAVAASLRSARKLEKQHAAALKVERDAAEVEAARRIARERAQAEEEELARLERGCMAANPNLRPSAKLPTDAANNFSRLAMTLDEDFVYFLSELD